MTLTLDAIISALAAIGIKLGVLIAAGIGGFCSLNFFEGTPQPDGTVKPLSCRQKWGIAFTGCALGTYAAGPIIELSQIVTKGDKVEIALGLVLAIFGMSVAAQVIKMIREFPVTDFINYVKSWFPKRG